MNILVCASYSESLISFRGQLIKELVVKGNQVVVASPKLEALQKEKLISLGVSHEEVSLDRRGSNILRDFRYLFSLIRIIKKHGINMVFTYTIKPNIYGAFAASVLKKQSVAMVTGIGTTFTAEGTTVSQKLIKALVFLMHKASLRLNKTVIFQNKDDIALFKELGLIQDGYHIEHVRGSGVDCTHYEFSSVPDSGNVLMISRLLRTKGVSEFCLAAKSLRQMGSDLTFVLVGPEERGQDSVSVAEVVRWSDGAVSYLGAVQDVRSHIAKSWLYVLPSYREGLSRSIAEALAMGRAVVTTDVPGCAELIQKGVTGYIISKGDHEELALAILEATRDRGKLKEMGVASREFACEYLDTKLINAKMLQILLG